MTFRARRADLHLLCACERYRAVQQSVSSTGWSHAMTEDFHMTEKVRRRLAPMIVERRIGEPAVTRSEAFAGGDASYVVTVKAGSAKAGQGSDLRGDVSRALADLGPQVVVAFDA
jgi:hypothetical protein